MNNKNLINRKSLKVFRSVLRNSSTSTEVALWVMLKSKKLEGRNSEDNTVLADTLLTFVVLQKN